MLPPTFDKRSSDTRDWSVRPRKRPEAPGEKRQAIRFKMALPVRYRTNAETGWGEVLNISSSGALFTTDRPLAVKTGVELNIKWPVLLFDQVQLTLVAVGKVSRVEPGKAAIRIEKYEFRTCGMSFFEQAPVPQPAAGAGCSPSASGPHFQVQVADHAMQGIGM